MKNEDIFNKHFPTQTTADRLPYQRVVRLNASFHRKRCPGRGPLVYISAKPEHKEHFLPLPRGH